MEYVIVTGANGLIGNYLTEFLSARGYYVYAVVRNRQENVDKIKSYPNVQIVYCELKDIANLDNRIEKRGFKAFFHLAWAGSSGEARTDYRLQLKNVQSFCDAAEKAINLQCKKFIGIGSVVELAVKDAIVRDDFKPELTAQYAFAKMASNYMSKCICANEDIEFNWAYVSNLYGVGDFTNNIVNYVMQSYIKNEVPELTMGSQLADFIYVSDVAEALAAIAENGRPGVSYYVGGNNIKPLKEFIVDIRSIVNPNIQSGLGRKQYNGQFIDYSRINVKQLFEDTGFSPRVSFGEGISKMFQWIVNNEKGR